MTLLVPSIGWKVSAGGASKVLTYQTTNSTGSGQNPSWAAQAIGTAAADRRVIVGVAGGNNSATISSVTCGGVSMTSVVEVAGGNHRAGLFILLVTSGTTATIQVNWSASQLWTGIGIWSCTGLSSDTPNHTLTDTTTSPHDFTLNTLAGGFAVAIDGNGASTAYSWTNLTERFDSAPNGTFSGADATTSAGTLAVSNTFTGSNSNRPGVAASW